MDRCDILIVGGGPAGSTLARQLVRAGLDVVVMDRESFPREKVCAGWITPQVIDSLELDLTHYARQHTLQPLNAFNCGLIGGDTVTIRYPAPVSFGIRRVEFDDYLLRRSGARLQLGEAFAQARRATDGWVVNGQWRTRLLVGAGGHFCPVARTLGAAVGRQEGAVYAQEAEFAVGPLPIANGHASHPPGELFFCHDLAGYGWCLRKGEFLNVGLGRETPNGLLNAVQDFQRWLVDTGRLPTEARPRFRGHAYLSYDRSRRPLLAANCLLVGDAAGLAYPKSGEGIRPAVESALLAARVIGAARGDYRELALRPYAALLAGRFGPRSATPVQSAAMPAGLLPSLRRAAARLIVANGPLARHLVLDRFFLHRTEAALHAPA